MFKSTVTFPTKEDGEISEGENVVDKPLMKDASTSTTNLHTASDYDDGVVFEDCSGDDNCSNAGDINFATFIPRRASKIFGPLPLYLINFQGFEGLDHDFIVKEMAVLERDDNHHVTTHNYFFKPPYPNMLLKASALLDNNCLH